MITDYDHWHYDDTDIYKDIVRYFTEQKEDISNEIYCPDHECHLTYAWVIRKEKTCVVVETLIQLKDQKISRYSIRNLETTFNLVHDFISCLSPKDRWATMKIKNLLNDIGFHVVLFKFRDKLHYNVKEIAITELMNRSNSENELQVTFGILSDSTCKCEYLGSFYVPVYLNGINIYKLKEACEYFDKKAFLCPGCFKAVTFGRDDESHAYVKACNVSVFEKLKRVSTPRGFTHHTRHCQSAFPKDGICKVVTDQQQYVIKKLARLSQKDAGWDFALVDDSFFREGDGTVYTYVMNGIPLSYIAFRKEDIPNHGSVYVIWDLYTLIPYRRQGLATSILDHGIKELNVNREYLPVSFPVTNYSSNIIRNASARYLMGRGGALFSRETFERVGSSK